MDSIYGEEIQCEVIHYNRMSKKSIIIIENILKKIETEFDEIMKVSGKIELKNLISDINTEKGRIQSIRRTIGNFFDYKHQSAHEFKEQKEDLGKLLEENEKNFFSEKFEVLEKIRTKIVLENSKLSFKDSKLDELFQDFLDTNNKYQQSLYSIEEITDKIKEIDLQITLMQDRKCDFEKMKIKDLKIHERNDDSDIVDLEKNVKVLIGEIDALKSKNNSESCSAVGRIDLFFISDRSVDFSRFSFESKFLITYDKAVITHTGIFSKSKVFIIFYDNFEQTRFSDITHLFIVIEDEDYDEVLLNFEKLEDIQAQRNIKLNLNLICNKKTYNKCISLKRKYSNIQIYPSLFSPKDFDKKLKEALSSISVSQIDKIESKKTGNQILLESKEKSLNKLISLNQENKNIKNEMEKEYHQHCLISNLITDNEINDLENEIRKLELEKSGENDELERKMRLSAIYKEDCEMSKNKYEIYRSKMNIRKDLENNFVKYLRSIEILKDIDNSKPVLNFINNLENEKINYIRIFSKIMKKTNFENYKNIYLQSTIILNNFENLLRSFLDQNMFPTLHQISYI